MSKNIKVKRKVDKVKLDLNKKIDVLLKENENFNLPLNENNTTNKKDYIFMKKLLLLEGLVTEMYSLLLEKQITSEKIDDKNILILKNEFLNLKKDIKKIPKASKIRNKKRQNGTDINEIEEEI